MVRLYATFERFLMSLCNARSNSRRFSQNIFLTSNGCKPIGVLTRTKSWTSADHLPIGYLLPDFQPHRSNFFIPPAAAAADETRKKGGRHVGGAPPPQTPPGEIVPIELLTKPRGRYLIVTKQQKPIQFFTNSLKIWKGGGGRLIKTCPGTQPTLCTASSINRKPIKCWTKSGELFIKDIVWSVKIAGKSWKKK